MSNTLLTPSQITRAALAVLHQKANFIGSINREYDSSFARDGAKIGDTLRIRKPNQYTVRTGLNMAAQDTVEQKVDLTVATVKGVDMYFTSTELALSLQDFTDRVIEPAMSVLAANIEAEALSMYKQVYNLVDQDAVAATLLTLGNGRKMLNDNLAPYSPRTALLTTDHSVKIIDSGKGLFQDSASIAKQYRDGMLGRTGGFEVMENTLLVPHTTGTAVKGDTTYNITATGSSGATQIAVDTGSTTFVVGDVITIANVFRVHPETKTSTGVLQQFVVTENYAGGTGNIKVSPAIITTGARQNVSALPQIGAAVNKIGAGNAETLTNSLVYHRDAFTFATADLPLPQGVDFAAREVMDGISMSLVRDFNISDRSFPCRIDVLFGYACLYPEWAARLHADA